MASLAPAARDRRRRSPRALAAARTLRRDLRIDDPEEELDIELVACAKELALGRKRLGSGAEGQLVRAADGTGLALIDERAFETQKWRFVAGHELGHFILHARDDSFERCFEPVRGHFARERLREREAEANDFATELLMPAADFGPLCDCARPSLHAVRPLAARFGMSLTATAMRFVELCPEPCALVWSTRGRVAWWDAGEDFALWIDPGSPLAQATVAYDAARGERVDGEPSCVEADAWGEPRGDGWHGGRDLELWEHSLALPEFDAVLTLLWQRGA
jgi:Zn-dependent peptidase ImmA (M78 family)